MPINRNTVKVYFKDGTDFETQGSSSGEKPINLLEDFKFIMTSLKGRFIDMNKSIQDVDSMEVSFKIIDND